MFTRDFIRKARMLLEQGLYESRRAFSNSADAALRPMDATQLEERILMSASPLPAAGEVPDAAATAESSASHQAAETGSISEGPTADSAASTEFQSLAAASDSLASQTQLTGGQYLDILAQSLGEFRNDVSAESTLELVFVDSGVPDIDQLISDLRSQDALDNSRTLEVVVLDSDRDGLAQITSTLLTHDGIDGIHIVSHGDESQVQLGSLTLSLENIDTYRSTFAAWQSSLSEQADLLFYGCNLAATDDGRELMKEISAACQCDVAASEDLTGHESLGGDWDLEYHIGNLESEIAFSDDLMADWFSTLDITSGQLLHTTFDSDASDSSVNNHDGTLTNGAFIDSTNSTDRVGAAKLSLDGSNDYVDLTAHQANFANLTQGTVAAWIRTTGTSQAIFSISDVDDPNSDATLSLGGGGFLTFEVYDNGTPELAVYNGNGSAINDGSWHHVAVTVGTSGNKLYIDGAEVAAGDLIYDTGSAATQRFFGDVGSIDAMAIGRNENSGGGRWHFNGLIDDARVYNRALSGSDISELVAQANSTSFQQGTGGYTGTQDTYINEGSTGTSYGSSTDIQVDVNDGSGDESTQALIRFDGMIGTDAGDVPQGVYITSASLVVETNNTSVGTISIYEMQQTWSESSVWDDFGGLTPGGELGSTALDSVAGPSGTVTFTNLESSVQKWTDGIDNFGWGIISSSTDGWDFDSSESANVPLLSVSYINPGSQASTAHTVTVDTTADILDGDVTSVDALLASRGADGFISLREAIWATNNTANIDGSTPDIINFAIGAVGSQQTITVSDVLPAITDAVVLDGLTQGGGGYSGAPLIEIDGSATTNFATAGIRLWSSGSTVRGFAFTNFDDEGIELDGANDLGFAADNNIIEDNWVGLDLSGNAAGNVDNGVLLVDNSDGNIIRNNVISSNTGDGIEFRNAGVSNNTIQGNLIGVAADGYTVRGNGGHGIRIATAADNNIIGGTAAGQANVIANSGNDGIAIEADAGTGNSIRGNTIYNSTQLGIDLANEAAQTHTSFETASGEKEVLSTSNRGQTFSYTSGNGTYNVDRISVQLRSAAVSAQNVTVSLRDSWNGTILGSAVIAESALTGSMQWYDFDFSTVTLTDGVAYTIQLDNDSAAGGIYVAQNSSGGYADGTEIDTNGSPLPGEDLLFRATLTTSVTPNDTGDIDTGANNLQNTPVLSSATYTGGTTDVAYLLNSTASRSFAIDFFANAGDGEGAIYLGSETVVTNGSGNYGGTANLTAKVPAGYQITATATDLTTGDTSEFSSSVTVTGRAGLIVNTNSDVSDGTTTSIAALLADPGTDGLISLREAITATNLTSNGATPDEIHFLMPNQGPYTIAVASALPTITQSVIIDGGMQEDVRGDGNAAVAEVTTGAEITIDASATTNAAGLLISGDNVTVRSLGVTDTNGTAVSASGIYITGENATIDDVTVSDAAVVGIYTGGSSGTTITNSVLRNNGVENNLGDGIAIQGPVTSFTVSNNEIIGNAAYGVDLTSGSISGVNITNNLIKNNGGGGSTQNAGIGVRSGSDSTIQGNQITGSAGDGISVVSTATGINITQNTIWGNGGLGIDLSATTNIEGDGVTTNDPGDSDTGANNLQNTPVITSAETNESNAVAISGTVNFAASTTYRIEFFSSVTGDGTGYGEAESFLGFVNVTTDGTGFASFTGNFIANVAIGDFITTTARDPGNNTSEFSANFAATAFNVAPTLTAFTAPVDSTNEDTEVEITFAELAAQGNENDSDGTVTAFVVKSIATGTLKIGTDAGSATAWAASTNDVIDATNNAYWTPAQDQNGTLNAFNVVARDNQGAESTGTVTAQVSVTAVNDPATVGTNTGATVLEGGSVTITTAMLEENDPDNSGSEIIYKLRFDTNNGTLLVSGAALEPNQTFTQADIDANNVVYKHAGAEDTTETIRLTISDGGAETNVDFAISVTPQNDAPIAADDPSGTVTDVASDADTIGYWRLNETGAATTAVSETGSNNGTYNNVTLEAADPFGGTTAGDFNGSSSYIDLGNINVAGSGITMAAWINADSFGGGDGRIFSKSSGTTGQDHTWMLSVIDIGPDVFMRLRLSAGGYTETLIASAPSLSTGQWYHVAATYDQASSEMALYVDGQLIEFGEHSVGGAVDQDGRGVRIGANPSNGNYFDGRIDEAVLMQRAITADEIAALAELNAPVYSTTESTVLNVNAANGILQNDSDVEGSALTVTQVDGAAGNVGNYFNLVGGGRLRLFNDGHFDFDPNGDFEDLAAGEQRSTTFTYTVTDGTDTDSATGTITVTGVNDNPTGSGSLTSTSLNDNAGATSLFGNLSVSDADTSENDLSVTITLTDPTAGTVSGGGFLHLGGGVYRATGLTVATANTALDNVTFTPTNNSGPSGTFNTDISVTVNDQSGGGEQTVLAPTTVTITRINDAPLLNLDANDSSGAGGNDFQTTFVEGGVAVNITDADATLTDADHTNLNTLIVTLTNELEPGNKESLSADVSGTALNANWDSAANVLTISGVGTVADFETVLRTIQYDNTSNNPDTTNRIITFVANDGLTNSLTSTTTVAVSATNNPPTISAIGNQTTNEDTATGPIAFTVDDAETAATALVVTATSNNQTLIPDANLTLGGSGANRTIDVLPSSNEFGGPVTITVSVFDGVLTTQTTFDVTITAVNDAPSITDAASVGLPGADEDTPTAGTTVSAIVNSAGWADVDAGTTRGMAVTGQTANGTWQYSTDAVAWTAFGAVSPTNALLLDGTTQIRFVGDGDNGEVPTLSFRAWDTTSGTASTHGSPSYTNPGSGGGTSAFSTESATGSATITSVNDNPTGSGSLTTTSLNDNAGATPLFGGLTVSDVDTGESDLSVTITLSNASAGTISGGGFSDLGGGVYRATGLTVATANTALDNVTFTPTNNSGPSGTFNTDISVTVNDQGGAGEQSVLAPTTVTITRVNDNPTGSGLLTTTSLNDNDGATALFGGLTVSDVDTGENDLSVTITLSNATAGTISGGGFTETGVGTGVYVSTGHTVATANTALDAVTFTPTNNSGSSGTFNTDISVTVNDQGGAGEQTVLAATTVTITRVNDAPVQVTNNALTVPEEGTRTITTAYLDYSDVDNPDSQITYTLTQLPGGTGQVRRNGLTLGLGGTFTQQDIIDNLVTFRFTDDASAETFRFTVSDGIATLPEATFSVNGTPVNDPPVNTVPGTQTGNEETTTAISGLSIADPDAAGLDVTTRLEVTAGVLNVNLSGGATVSAGANNSADMTLQGTDTEINAALATLTYTGNTDVVGTNADTLTVTTNDGGNTGSGGALQDVDTVQININNVNDNPSGSGSLSTTSLNDNAGATAIFGGLTVSDVDAGETDLSVTITLSDPAAGMITGGGFTETGVSTGVYVSTGHTVATANMAFDNANFTPTNDSGPSGTFNTDISATVNDHGGAGEQSVLAPTTVTVTRINDNPTGSGSLSTTSLNDNAGATSLFGGLTVSDVDTGESDLSVTITLTNPTAGTISGGGFTETGVGTGVYVSTGHTVATANTALDTATFTPTDNSGPSGTFNTDISATVNDQGGAGEQAVLAPTTVTITRVNDSPTGSGSLTTTSLNDNAGATAIFGGLTVSDVDAGETDLSVTITLTDPTAGTISGGGFTETGVGTGVYVSTGHTVATANTAFDSATFTPTNNSGPNGTFNTDITATVNDQDGAGEQSVLAPTTVTITRVNDIPVMTAGATLSWNEGDGPLAIDGTLTISDVDDTMIESAVVQITGNLDSPNDILAASLGGGISGSTWTPGTGTLTLSGTATLAQYQSTLRAVTFDNGSATPSTLDRTVRWTVFDGDGNSLGVTSTIQVTSVNNAPVLVNNAITILEGGTVTLSATELSTTDPDDADSSLTFNVSGVTGGQFEFVSAPQTAITSFTQAQVTASQVVFVHDGSEIAPTYSITVTDGTTPVGPAAVGVTFTNVNDAPVLSAIGGDSVTIFNNGTPVPIDTGASAALQDSDSPANYNGGFLQISGNGFAAADQLNLNTTGGVSLSAGFSNGSVVSISGLNVGTLSGVSTSAGRITFNTNTTAAHVNTLISELTFATTSTTLGGRTIDLTFNDGHGTANGGTETSSVETVNIFVAQAGNGLVTINEDTTYIFVATDFDFTGITGNDLQQIEILALPTNGTLLYNGSNATVGEIVTKADIDGGLLRFVPVADENGASYASFDFRVNNGKSVINVLAGEPNSFTLNGGSLPDTDAILADTTNFGVSGTYPSYISVGATSSTIDASYLAQGSILFNGYVPDGNWTSAELAALDTWVNAGGVLISNSDHGSYDAVSDFYGLTIGGSGDTTWHVADDTSPIMNGPFGLVGNNNDPFNATGAISYFDGTSLDGGDQILATDSVSGEPTIVLRSVGSGWILFTSDEGIFRANTTGGGAITTANDRLAANIFAWAADHVPASSSHTIGIDVTAVNDDPTNSGGFPASITVDEDVPTAVDLSSIDLQDVDSATGNLTMTLTTTGSGTLSAVGAGGVSVSGSGTGVLTLIGNSTDLNSFLNNTSAVNFTGALNVNGTSPDGIQVDITDNGNVGTGGGGTINFGTINVDISAVNDAPINTVPGTQTVAEETLTAISGISIADVDAATGSLTTQLQVTNGILNVTLSGSSVISSGSNGTADLTISGNVTDINNTLASLTYQPNTDITGTAADTLGITTDDGGNTGGAALQDTDFLQIDVTNVNDEEVLAVNNLLIVNEGDLGRVIGQTLLDTTDVDNSVSQIVYTLRNPPTSGTLRLGGSALSTNDTFTQLDINSGFVTYDHNDSEVFTDSFNFRVDDGIGTFTDATFNIQIDPFNDNDPTITSGTAFSVAENSTAVTTVTATDADLPGQTLTFSIAGGADAGRFNIVGGTGVLTFATAPDFEARADSNGDNIYGVIVEVDDGLGRTSQQTVNVTVTDVDEFDVTPIVDNNAAADQINENVALGTNVGITAFSEDLDDTTSSITYSLDDSAGGLFTIDAVTGIVSTNAAIDYESTGGWLNITVRATSQDLSTTTRSFAITVNDVDEFDVTPIVDNNAATDEVTENDAIGTAVGITVFSADLDATNNTVTYSLDDSAGGLFAIDAATGVVTINAAIDYETTGNALNIIARATSTDGSTTTRSFTIAVNDIDEFDVAPIVDNNAAADQINENVAIGTNVGITAFSEDLDGTTNGIIYALDDSAGGLFTIDSANGIVYTNAAIDFEATGGTLNITVRATSQDLSTTTRSFAITVNDLNDNAPIVTPGQFFSVNEFSTVGTSVGFAVATDVDTGTVLQNWTIAAGNSNGIFVIDPGTGELSIVDNTNLNFESTNSYILTLTVGDGANTSSSQTISVAIIDQNDAPVLNPAGPFSVNEDSANGTVVGSASASDEDTGDVLTYRILGGTGAFAINGGSGQISVADVGQLDFETTTSFTLTVEVEDTGSLTDTQFITINLNDVNENPVDLTLSGGIVAENSINGTVVGSVTGSDLDAGEILTYSLTDTASGRFTVDANTGLITVADGSLLDFEAASSHNITVRTTDSGGLRYDESFTITITDVNESPVAAGEAFSGNQLETLSAPVGALLANDSDVDGDILTVVLVTGPTNGSLTLNADGSFDYTPTGSFSGMDSFTYYATDGILNSAVVTADIEILTTISGVGNDDESSDTSSDEGDNEKEINNTDEPTDKETGDATEDIAHDSTLSPILRAAGEAPSDQMTGFARQDVINEVVRRNNGEQFVTIFMDPVPEETALNDLKAERRDTDDEIESQSSGMGTFLFAQVTTSQPFFSFELSAADEFAYAQQLREQEARVEMVETVVIGSTAAVTTSATIGYIVYMLRGGSLLATILSSLPAWQAFDPLLVLSQFEDEAEGADDESLASLVSTQDQS